jgi:hypothetical protein
MFWLVFLLRFIERFACQITSRQMGWLSVIPYKPLELSFLNSSLFDTFICNHFIPFQFTFKFSVVLLFGYGHSPRYELLISFFFFFLIPTRLSQVLAMRALFNIPGRTFFFPQIFRIEEFIDSIEWIFVSC